MTSEYNIITIAELVKEVKLPFNTYVDSSNNRQFSDVDIEAGITQQERLVLGWLDNTGLTSTTAPALVKYAITLLAGINMKNDLLAQGYLDSNQYTYLDPIIYFKDIVQPILQDRKMAEGIKDVQGVDNYID